MIEKTYELDKFKSLDNETLIKMDGGAIDLI